MSDGELIMMYTAKGKTRRICVSEIFLDKCIIPLPELLARMFYKIKNSTDAVTIINPKQIHTFVTKAPHAKHP